MAEAVAVAERGSGEVTRVVRRTGSTVVRSTGYPFPFPVCSAPFLNTVETAVHFRILSREEEEDDELIIIADIIVLDCILYEFFPELLDNTITTIDHSTYNSLTNLALVWLPGTQITETPNQLIYRIACLYLQS